MLDIETYNKGLFVPSRPSVVSTQVIVFISPLAPATRLVTHLIITQNTFVSHCLTQAGFCGQHSVLNVSGAMTHLAKVVQITDIKNCVREKCPWKEFVEG